jgi:predicted ATPase
MENIYKQVLKSLQDKKIDGFLLEMKAHSEKSLLLSFWNRRDWRNGTPCVYFEINEQYHCSLVLVDDNGEKGAFFQLIAPEFSMQPEDKLIDNVWFKIWVKKYPSDAKTYLNQLYIFLEKDRPFLNDLINKHHKQPLLPLISEADFKRNLNKIPKKVLQEAAPLRLRALQLQNICSFRDIEIHLDQPVTCLIGSNGSGKTVILRAIALGLAGVESVKRGTPKEDWENELSHPTLQKLLRIKTVTDAQQLVFEPEGRIEIVYNAGKQENKNIIKFEVDPEEVNRMPIKVSDESNGETALMEHHFTTLVVGFAQGKNNSLQQTPRAKSFESQPSVEDVLNLILNCPDEMLNHFTSWLKSLCALGNTPARMVGRKVATKVFEICKKIVGGEFKHELKEGSPPDIFIQTDYAPIGVPIELLSQGYSNVLGWIGYFMWRLWQVTSEDKRESFHETPAICLVDEIDTYLHLQWQYSILETLINHFPNVQFIVTTHSPYVVGSIPNDKIRVYICENEDSETKVSLFDPSQNLYGANIERITRLLFRSPARVEVIEQKIMDLRAAIQNNQFEEAERLIKSLGEHTLSPDDPELMSIKLLLKTKKRLASR